MSHMVKVKDFEINSLSALQAACRRVGFQFKRNQRTARYYSGHAEVDHAISVPEVDWEIGVLEKKKNGRVVYELEADFYGGKGKKMEKAVRQLKQAYAVELAREVARKRGYAVREQRLPDGSIKLTVEVVG